MQFKNHTSVAAILAAVAWNGAAAQDSDENKRASGIEEITVTATKRAESAQDIPVAVSALSGGTLDDLDVDNFTDYLLQLPSVTAGGVGPGQGTIYIRGLASTTPQTGTAAVAGLAPNVALYLDETPVSMPGRNLDIYAIDLERIEALAGPQGTLFGASSQAGTIRLITNKPVLNEFEAQANFGVSFTDGGEMSTKVEGIFNIPVVEDKFALRAVAYVDDQGGFIDNVAGTVSLAESARFRPAGTVRQNGVPVNALRGGFQAGQDLSGVNFIEARNDGLVEDDFNDTQYAGFRLAALWEVNENWRLNVMHARQSLESDGAFLVDPEAGDDLTSISRFEDEFLEDDYSTTSWTLEGQLGDLEMIYTGAYTERETDQRIDYTDYLFVGQYLPYYICDGTVSYPGSAAPSGTCQAPNLYVAINSDTSVQTHELRFNTPAENRWRITAGGFYSDLAIEERNDFAYPGNLLADTFGTFGFAQNFAQTNGFTSDDGPFPAETIFRNDVRRTDKQYGFFGEASFDVVPDTLTITFGTRYYDVDVDLEGSANGSFCNANANGTDANAFGTNIDDLYDGDGRRFFNGSCDTSLHQFFTTADTVESIVAAIGGSEARAQQILNGAAAPDVANTNGFIFKGNISYTPNEDMLFYVTYSEGFRPGLLNRPGGAIGPSGFTVPFEVETDEVSNYEFGWKLDLFDRQFRFNGNAFYVDVQSLQTTIFDPSITNLFFSDNAANAEIYGIEGDFIIAPASVPGLTIFAAFSILDTEITEVLLPTNDVLVGTDLAYAPNFSGNTRVRYDWDAGNDISAYIQTQLVYTGEQRSDIVEINAGVMDDWATLGLSGGIRKDNWTVDVFIENITDERGPLNNFFGQDRERLNILRPLTAGVRVGFSY